MNKEPLIVMKKKPVVAEFTEPEELPEEKVNELREVTDELAAKVYKTVSANINKRGFTSIVVLSPRALELFVTVNTKVPNFTSVVSALILAHVSEAKFKEFWFYFCSNLFDKGLQAADITLNN